MRVTVPIAVIAVAVRGGAIIGVAIKLLHPGLAADPESRRRFENEARSAAALNHPNIVAIHDSGEERGVPFIVMERLPGNTLADLVSRGALPQPAVRTVLAEVLAALAVAHRAGILHRDVKPGNILFTSSGMAKVGDFGIAKTTETNHTVAGQIVGTVAYLSPERLGGHPATPADDLYSVGVVGYEALTGRRAFPQDTLGALSHAIMTQRPPALMALRPDVDPAFAALVERAMAPRAQWRFGTAEEMNAALSNRSAETFRPAAPVHDVHYIAAAADASHGGSASARSPTPDEPNEEIGRGGGGPCRHHRHSGGVHRGLVDRSHSGSHCADHHDERHDLDEPDDHRYESIPAAHRSNEEARTWKWL